MAEPAERPAPAALLLDALGTLVALEPPAAALRRGLRDRAGISVSQEQAESAIAAEITYYRGHLDEGRDRASLAGLRRRCAEALRAALPASPELASLSELSLTELLLGSLRFRAFADVSPVLRAARARGIRIVVVSNWDVSLHEVLARLGLDLLLDGIITSAEVGRRKPAPEIFEQALTLAGVPAERALHVGDSLAEDVAGARAAGVEPVLLVREGDVAPGAGATRVIRTLRELPLSP
jgi:putative hydrolase of the HAD superfamily